MTHDTFIKELRKILAEELTPQREEKVRDIVKYVSEPATLFDWLDAAEDDPEATLDQIDNHKHQIDD